MFLLKPIYGFFKYSRGVKAYSLYTQLEEFSHIQWSDIRWVFPNHHTLPIYASRSKKKKHELLKVFHESSYRPLFLATQCLPDWHWCQAHRDPDTRALWQEPRRMCWRRLSVCGPWSVHMERRYRCCQLERGDEEVEGPALTQGNPSAQRQKGERLGWALGEQRKETDLNEMTFFTGSILKRCTWW